MNGTAGDDAATLTAHATLDGWFTFAGATFETIHFERPSVSLLVDALGGDDTVTVTGANGELDFGSIPVTIRAERIVVDGATLTTTGALVLDAEAVDNGSPTLIVVDWVTDASPNASVRLVNGATVRGGSVELGARATTVNTPPTEQLLILVVDADALVEVTGGSRVEATSGDATLRSEVTVTGNNPAVGDALFGSSTTNAAAAWAHVTTSSQVLVDAGSSVQATGASCSGADHQHRQQRG